MILLRLAAALLLSAVPVAAAAQGFRVDGPTLRDAGGQRFVLKGVNMAHAWQPRRSARDLPAIAATGANAIRIALGTGCAFRRTPIEEVRALVAEAKAHRLAIVLEVHDATGFGEKVGSCPVAAAVDYWKTIKPALEGEEAFLIVNIANEPRGNNDAAKWLAETADAVREMRAAGFRHLLMIDAPNWGQDHEGVMRTRAAEVLKADPLGQLIFSVHMYGVYDSEAKVTSYIRAFADGGLALTVGEFGDHFRGTAIPAETVMRESETRANGWLAWSWTPNGPPDANLDLVVDSDPARPTDWGRKVLARLVGAPRASVYAPRR